MNTKVEGNFVHTTWTQNLHYLESGRGRYGTGKEGLQIRKIWLILWKPSLLLSQGGSRARQGGARPKAPQGHKYNPLGSPRWLLIDIHSSESRRKMRKRELDELVARINAGGEKEARGGLQAAGLRGVPKLHRRHVH
jgi:hypothetical protein